MPTCNHCTGDSGTRARQALAPLCGMVALFGLTTAVAWGLPADAAHSPAGNSGGPDDAAPLEFSTAFTASNRGVDVSRFGKGHPILPGTYNVDLFVNGVRIGRRNIEFQTVPDDQVAQPCFDDTTLNQMEVDLPRIDAQAIWKAKPCRSIQDVSSAATVQMDVSALRLDVAIPQETLKRQARGYVDPALWDAGKPAFLLGYNLSAYSLSQKHKGQPRYGNGTALGADGSTVQIQYAQYYTPGPNGSFVPSNTGHYMLSSAGQFVPVERGTYAPEPTSGYSSRSNSAYLGLDMGLNLGGWRLRSQETAQWDQRVGRTRWSNLNTTANHDLTAWRAQLTLGDSYTQGIVFDTTAFRGMTVYSDDRMLPDSQQGYAPVVRGEASTQARVEVRQNGNLLYQTTVAPGPFVIDDLYATGYGGDLTVTIFEADGSTHRFIVPYAAVPMLLRPGISRWSVTTGQVRNMQPEHPETTFLEGTYQRGINNRLTLYGGLQSSESDLYRAVLVGGAVNTEVGAFALDTTQARTHLEGMTAFSGYSYRASYSKALPTAGTTFALASYRYSSGNYLSLSDATLLQRLMSSLRTSTPAALNFMQTKQRLNVNINQSFGDGHGQLFFNGSRNTYWKGASASTTYQLGYNNTWKRLNFGLSASRTYTAGPMYNGARYDNAFGFNVSIPLDGPSSSRLSQLQLTTTHDSALGDNHRASVNGAFGYDRQYNYNASATSSDYANSSSSTTIGGSLGWQAPYSDLTGSYSYSSRYQQASANLAGSLVIHGGGITLAPQMDINSPIAIIEAPHAEGARVSSSGQTRVDSHGYAVATNLMAYRTNDVTLDPSGTSTDVELETTRLQTDPRAGAVVPLKFTTSIGRAVLIHATQASGEAVPFGAAVFGREGQRLGEVGQNGHLFVRGSEAGGDLRVQWGKNEAQECTIHYQLHPRSKNHSRLMESIEAPCLAPVKQENSQGAG